jgi:lysophospholipase L1-like esterase
LKWPDPPKPPLPSQQPMSQPSRKVNALVFGDSLTKYLPQYLSSKFVNVHVHTWRGATINRLRRIIHGQDFPSSNMDIIVLHVGTNDLQWGFLHSNVRELSNLIVSVREIFPLSKILVTGILPRFDNEDLDTSRFMHNVKFGNLCQNFANCKFVDFRDNFQEWHFC